MPSSFGAVPQPSELVITPSIVAATSTTVSETSIKKSGNLAYIAANVPSGINGANVQIDILNHLGEVRYTFAAVAKGSVQFLADGQLSQTNLQAIGTLPVAGRVAAGWTFRVTSASAEADGTALGTFGLVFKELFE